MANSFGATLRETGAGESERPTPTGDYNGLSRVKALDQLLNKHHAEICRQKKVGTKSWFERIGETLALLEVA